MVWMENGIMHIIVLSLVIIIFLVILSYSVKRTLYSIWNVMIIAGIIYGLIADLNCILNHVLGLTSIEHLGINFAKAALPIYSLGQIFLVISNIVLIKKEGFRLKNLVATILGGMIVAGSHILMVMTNYFAAESFFIRYFMNLLCYLECIMFGIIIMGYISAKQIPAYDKDFIIILGCSISKKGGLLPLLKGRTNRAIKYAWEQEIATGKPLRYVPSGGQGRDEVMSEGSAMALYLEAHSAESYEVLPEKESKNTYENFLFSHRIIEQEKADARVAFATTNYHVFRSGLLARKAGFGDIEAISSATKWYFWPNGFAREIVGILALTWKVHAAAALLIAAAIYFTR